MTDASKLVLVEDLRGYDHGFLNETGVKHFADGFGVKLTPYKHKANPRDPKGLTLDNGAKEAVGLDAADMAESICNALGVQYARKMGRGSQLRACCDALQAHYATIDQIEQKRA